MHARQPKQKDAYWEDRSVRPGMSDWHRIVGQLVHRCCGDLAETRSRPRQEIAESIIEWVNANARSARALGNLPKARSQIGSLAGAYLFGYAPDETATYLGSEIAFDGGRLDLVWDVPSLGVVIDELKTTTWVRLGVDATMLGQARRYRDFGVAEWGQHFAGVRFLPLMHPHEARFLGPDDRVMRLSDSPGGPVGKRAA